MLYSNADYILIHISALFISIKNYYEIHAM